MRNLMACGHIATARDEIGDPVCPICMCWDVAKEVEGNEGLEGRVATCCYGPHGAVPSSWELPFFEYKPNATCDKYYCGCYGWD